MRPTKEVNSNFRIKVNGHNFRSGYITRLVGVSGLVRLVGKENAEKLIDRAFNETDKDIVVCRLRRGIIVRFYTK